MTRNLHANPLVCHARAQHPDHAISRPRTTAVTFDILLPPLTVNIYDVENPLEEGETINPVCETAGSHPPADITWWKNGSRLIQATTSVHDGANVSSSSLSLSLRSEDDGMTLLCEAVNPKLKTRPLLDSVQLNVFFSPKVELVMGSHLNASDLREGHDAFMECRVSANPPHHRLEWFKNGDPLSASDGVIISGASLIFQKLRKSHRGKYSCSAANLEGDAKSEEIAISINYAPTCVTEGSEDTKPRTQGAAMGRPTSLSCQVDAKPPRGVEFKWSRISSSGEVAKLPVALISVNEDNPLISTISFTPEDINDYGTYVCRASNSIGTQEKPCEIALVTAGPPEPPGNCSSNPVRTGVNVSCSGGFHGGYPQTFFLQAWQKKRLIANLTSDTPSWMIEGLAGADSLRLKLRAMNERGWSDAVTMEVHSPIANQQATTESTDDDKSMSLVAGVVMGVLLILLFLLMATLVLVHRKQGRHSTKTGEQSGHIPSTSASSQCHDPTFVEASSSPPPSSPSQDQMISPRIASPLQEPCRTTSPVPSYNRRVSPENGNLPVTCNREIFFAPHQRPLLYHTRSQILQNDVDEYLPETSMDSVRAVLAVPYTDRKERFSPLQYRRQTLPSHPLLSPRYMSKSVPHSLFDPWGPDGSLNRRELRARNTSGQIRSSKFQKVASHVTPEGYAAQGEPQASSASPQSKPQNRDEVTVVPASMGRSPSSLKIDPLGEPSLMMGAIKKRDSFHLLEYPNTPKLVPRMGSKVQLVNPLAKDDLEVEIKKGYSNEDDNTTARSRLIVRPLVGGEHLDSRRAQPYGEFHQRENATMPSSCLRGQDGLKSSFSASTTSDGRAKLSPSGDSRPSLTTRPQGSATQRESRV